MMSIMQKQTLQSKGDKNTNIIVLQAEVLSVEFSFIKLSSSDRNA